MKKKNCWEVMKCGREPGGKGAQGNRPCPAAISSNHDGVNDGDYGGRYCWSFAGTFCGGELQGSVAKKLQNCQECGFFMKVQEEEGENFTLINVPEKQKEKTE